jgi:hypothetical protein
MAEWRYTIESGKALREAIDDDDIERTVRCLYRCFKELYDKMSDEDKDYYQFDIEDTMEILKLYDEEYDDEDNVNYYLEEFYNICDDVRAWVPM